MLLLAPSSETTWTFTINKIFLADATATVLFFSTFFPFGLHRSIYQTTLFPIAPHKLTHSCLHSSIYQQHWRTTIWKILWHLLLFTKYPIFMKRVCAWEKVQWSETTNGTSKGQASVFSLPSLLKFYSSVLLFSICVPNLFFTFSYPSPKKSNYFVGHSFYYLYLRHPCRCIPSYIVISCCVLNYIVIISSGFGRDRKEPGYCYVCTSFAYIYEENCWLCYSVFHDIFNFEMFLLNRILQNYTYLHNITTGVLGYSIFHSHNGKAQEFGNAVAPSLWVSDDLTAIYTL